MTSNQTTPFYVPIIASGLSALTVAPLELAATRSKSKDVTLRSFRLINDIARRDGILSLWKGCSWFVAATAVSRGIWMLSYDRIRNHLDNQGYSLRQSILIASLSSGMLNAIVGNPVWTIKTFAQLPNYPGLLYPRGIPISQILNNSPEMKMVQDYRRLVLRPRILMAGVTPATTYVGIESVAQLFVYEYLRQGYLQYINDESSPLVEGSIGALSRATMLPFTYPLHVVTLRYRENMKPIINNGTVSVVPSSNLVQIIRNIHHQKAWYNGGLAYTARVVPQAGALFFFREIFNRVCAK